jgi:8-oxo-dGTP pyrophosphatase MutT (NUDIX family)
LSGDKTPKEKSAGAVVFRHDEESGKILYLILHYHFKGDYWDFSRGKTEVGESEQETATREIREETTLADLEFVDGFREVTHWFYRWKGDNVFKEAVYFLAETKTSEVEISKEHIDFAWADYETAMKTLTFENTKKILKAAHEFLEKKM